MKKSGTARYIMIVIGACLMTGMTYFLSTSLSYYYDYICAEFGFNRASLSVYYAILSTVGVFAGVVVLQKFFPKYGARKLLIIFGTITGVAYMGFSLCTQLWQFYILAAIVGFCGSALCSGLSTILIYTWFMEKQGLIIGVSSAMSGVFGVILAVPLGNLISSGWRAGYILCGAIFLAAALLTGIVLYRNSPSDCGMMPYGYEKAMAARERIGNIGKASGISGIAFKNAVKSTPFWMFCLGIVFLGFTLGFGQNSFSYFSELGFDPASAAASLGVMSGAMIVWKILLGVIADKLGGMWTWILAMGITFCGIVLQILSGSSNAIIPYGPVKIYAQICLQAPAE